MSAPAPVEDALRALRSDMCRLAFRVEAAGLYAASSAEGLGARAAQLGRDTDDDWGALLAPWQRALSSDLSAMVADVIKGADASGEALDVGASQLLSVARLGDAAVAGGDPLAIAMALECAAAWTALLTQPARVAPPPIVDVLVGAQGADGALRPSLAIAQRRVSAHKSSASGAGLHSFTHGIGAFRVRLLGDDGAPVCGAPPPHALCVSVFPLGSVEMTSCDDGVVEVTYTVPPGITTVCVEAIVGGVPLLSSPFSPQAASPQRASRSVWSTSHPDNPTPASR